MKNKISEFKFEVIAKILEDNVAELMNMHLSNILFEDESIECHVNAKTYEKICECINSQFRCPTKNIKITSYKCQGDIEVRFIVDSHTQDDEMRINLYKTMRLNDKVATKVAING